MSFGAFDLHRFSYKKHTTKNTHKVKVPSSIYDLMLMTKELNNENSDSNRITFMGKEPLLYKCNREINYNQILSVEKSLLK